MPKLGLLSRIALGLALAGLVPVMLSGWLLTEINEEALAESALRSQTAAVQSAATALDGFLRLRSSLALTLVSQPGLRRSEDRDELMSFVGSVLEANPDLLAVVASAADGEEAFRVQRRGVGAAVDRVMEADQRRPDQRIWYQETDSGALVAVRTSEREFGEVSLTLVFDNRELVRTVRGSGTFDDLSLTVISDEGGVLAGDRGDVADLTSGEALARVAANRRAAIDNGLAVMGTLQMGESVSAYSGLELVPWFVVAQQDTSRAFAIRRRMVRNAASSVALALLLVVLLATAAYASVVRPLRSLLHSQRALAGLQELQQGGGNEIAGLEASFKALQEKLRAGSGGLDEAVIDRYEIREILGGGSMGLVFRAWDPQLRREVALKTIRLDPTLSDAERATQAMRLVEEAAAMAHLNHPNVVQVFDAKRAGGSAFLAMELAPGTSLEQHLQRHWRLSLEQTLEIAHAVAQALRAAHAAGLVHQDIKPGNILLVDDGGVKVTDFGVANVVNEVAGDASTVYGTPGFLPPEVLQGDPFEASGDLFALGAVLYQCLTGYRPFEGDTVSEIVRATLDGTYPPVGEERRGLPPEVARLVGDLLATSPYRRIRSADALIVRLRSIDNQERASDEPTDLASPRRRRAAAAPATQKVATQKVATRERRCADGAAGLGRTGE